MFSEPEKELKQAEYKRLLGAAKLRKNERLNLLMQTSRKHLPIPFLKKAIRRKVDIH